MHGPHFEYQIRESARAKYMSLRVTVERGLEIVIPRGFNRTLIQTFLKQKQEWVQAAMAKVQQERDRRTSKQIDVLPSQISLPAVGRTWVIEYVEKRSKKISLTDEGQGLLRINGPIDNIAGCHAVLQRWMHRQAFTILIPWLRQLSHETGIAFARTAIRRQKSRWGSCSTSGTISLNQKLLLIEPDLVRYVLVHELCHMREMNHSRHFWRLVGQFHPDYRLARRRLRDAWFQMPGWAG